MTRTRKIALSALAAVLGLGAIGAAVPAIAQHAAARGGMQLFRNADADRDGRVTQDEAWNALSARFAEADANRDGGVSWDEARAYAQAQRGNHPAPPAGRQARMEERAQGVFRGLDADRDGKITLAELRPAGEAMFRARDTNGDGALSRDEIRPHRARAERPANRAEGAPQTPATPQ